MCHKLTRARTDESPFCLNHVRTYGEALVLLGRPVRTRLELHPEQAPWTKSGNFMAARQSAGQTMAEVREFHAQYPGYLFFTCSLQAMAYLGEILAHSCWATIGLPGALTHHFCYPTRPVAS